MEPKIPLLKEWEENFIQLTNSGKEMVSPEYVIKGKTIGWYFTSNSCKPCRTFVKQLEATRDACKAAGKPFEVVVVSQDYELKGFDEYMSHSKFHAILFDEKELRKKMKDQWFVKSWPWVVITDDTGKVLNPKANDVLVQGVEKFPFMPPLVRRLADMTPLSMNKQVCFYAFVMNPKASPHVKPELESLAKANKDIVFSYIDDVESKSKMANKIKKFAGAKAGTSCYAIIDVLGRVNYVREDTVAGSASRFISEYQSGSLSAQEGTGQIPSKPDLDTDNKGPFDYDLFVVGGGSGGLACAKAAAAAGKKVAVADFVRPSPQGTTWGLGGTCVNVGCIPKKLCHTAALLGESFHDALKYGWKCESKNMKIDWKELINNVQEHIKGLNTGSQDELKSKDVTYYNAFASFVDKNTAELKFGWDENAKVEKITARRFVIACGGRPRYPSGEGLKELSITSDDIFSMEKPPGKTLVIGASYVALECAGFLTGLGFDTTVMVRSIFLRGFDQQMAGKIADYMEKTGTKFLRGFVPVKAEKTAEGKIKVTYKPKDGTELASVEVDTLLMAIGRVPETKWLNVDKLGFKFDRIGKILTATNEQTTVPNIYCIGDAASEKLELTPVAIQAGRLLAARLYKRGQKLMRYDLVPTTVFTPLEYGAIGLSEESAIEKYGEDNIEVYHSTFRPLEMFLAKRMADDCYVKLVCNKARNETVLGFHILGPHAGEMTQGFAVAMRKGATKADFDDTVGIHPTAVEELTLLEITKSSGASSQKAGC